MVESVSRADQMMGFAVAQNATWDSIGALESVVVAQALGIALKIAAHGIARKIRPRDLIERGLQIVRNCVGFSRRDQLPILEPGGERAENDKSGF